MVERRSPVMQAWADYLGGETATATVSSSTASGGDPSALKLCRAKSDQTVEEAHWGAREAVCDTSSHFPSRFSKTSVSNVGAVGGLAGC